MNSSVFVITSCAALLLSTVGVFALAWKRDRQRTARLRRTEDRYRLIVENQTDFVVKWLPDGTRTFVNESYCRYFGVHEQECLGSSFIPLVVPEFRESIVQKIASLTPAHPEATDEHLSFVAGGGRRWQEWIDRGIFDSSGNLVQLLSTGRDITDRKEVEQKLAEVNRRNEELRVALDSAVTRKRQLELQLRQSQKTGAVDQIAGGVAHDLNDVLTVINDHAELHLEAAAPDDPVRHRLQEMRNAAQRATQLIGQLLAFSRSGGRAPHRGMETLLLVEDEDAVRDTSQRVLRTRGYTVLATASGEEALQVAARHSGKIDLLLTDVVMPGMSGRQLAEALRGENPGMKVLFMSGYTSEAILQYGVLRDSADFLEKPFSAVTLTEKVRSILDRPIVT